MNVKIKPSVACGKINAPPSKSFAHRLLICAALAKGRSVVENIGENDDVSATVNCLRALGATVELGNNSAVVDGISIKERAENVSLNCNESGSTLRFLTPLSLVFAKNAEFCGSQRLLERPQNVYETLFKEKECCFTRKGNTLLVGGKLTAGEYRIRGDVSSQFLTGLLFALPLLDGDSEIFLTTPLESSPYIDITVDALSLFGISVERKKDGFGITGNQRYLSTSVSVEGDWSNAAFLDAYNLIGGDVKVGNLNKKSHQGDRTYLDFYRLIKSGTPNINISDCPDLGPVLIACAALCNGGKFTGTNRLRIKESDRAAAMKTELDKFGVNIIVNDDEIIVPKSEIKPSNVYVSCHNDHRIAMAMALICSKVGGTLADAQCVCKSYPAFFDDIRVLGIECEIVE